MLFQVLAEGPGEAVGSGGRYDRLFDRFGLARSAAGFAIDLGNLGWALERSGAVVAVTTKVLVSAAADRTEMAEAVLGELRRRGVACAIGPEGRTDAYARAWRYTHTVVVAADAAELVELGTGAARSRRAPILRATWQVPSWRSSDTPT